MKKQSRHIPAYFDCEIFFPHNWDWRPADSYMRQTSEKWFWQFNEIRGLFSAFVKWYGN